MTHTSDAIDDYEAGSWTNDLSGYAGIFLSNTNLADGMDYSNFPQLVRDAIWDAFDDAETAGYVADIGRPTDYPADAWASPPVDTSYELTEAECRASLAARIAHGFWVELTQGFSWSILKYDLESCQSLFSAYETFRETDFNGWGTGDPLLSGTDFIDYSVKRHWDKASTFLSSPQSADIAVAQVLDANRLYTEPTGFQHGFTGAYGTPCDITDHYDAQNISSDDETWPDGYRAHIGCWYACGLFKALLNSLNIPAFRVRYKYVGRNHCSLVMPTLNPVTQHPELDSADPPEPTDNGLVLSHGDHVYFKTWYAPVWGRNILINRRYWDAHVANETSEASLYKWTIRADLADAIMFADTPSVEALITTGTVAKPPWSRRRRADLAQGFDPVSESGVFDDVQALLAAKDNGRTYAETANLAYIGNADIVSSDFRSASAIQTTGEGWFINMDYVSQFDTGTDLVANFYVEANKDRRMGNLVANGVKLFQICEDDDFEIESRWVTIPVDTEEIGMAAWQDDLAWAGCAFYNDAGTVKFKAGLLSGVSLDVDVDASATITGQIGYMRLGRTGDSWLAQYSANGTDWVTPSGSPFTSIRTINRVMLYAGNSDINDLTTYNMRCDYFFENSARISPEDP